MQALFSVIFGVGIVLFMARKEKQGQSATGRIPAGNRAIGLFFRRMGWRWQYMVDRTATR